MAYVTVPKDLTHVKSKVVFGLTKRQLICFSGALVIGVPLYFLTRDYLTNSAAALLMVFAMLPMSESVMDEASTRLVPSSCCASDVDAVVPSSCPCMLSLRSAQ